MPPRRALSSKSSSSSSTWSPSSSSASDDEHNTNSIPSRSSNAVAAVMRAPKKRKSSSSSSNSSSSRERTTVTRETTSGPNKKKQKVERRFTSSSSSSSSDSSSSDSSDSSDSDSSSDENKEKNEEKENPIDNRSQPVTPEQNTSSTQAKIDRDSLSLIFSALNTRDFSTVMKVDRQWNGTAMMNSSWPKYDLVTTIANRSCQQRRIVVRDTDRLLANAIYRRANEIVKSNAQSLLPLTQMPQLSSATLIVTTAELITLNHFLSAMRDRLVKLNLTISKFTPIRDNLHPRSSIELLTHLRSLTINFIPPESMMVNLHALEYFAIQTSHPVHELKLVRVLRYLAVRHSLRAVSGVDSCDALCVQVNDVHDADLPGCAINQSDPTRFGFVEHPRVHAVDLDLDPSEQVAEKMILSPLTYVDPLPILPFNLPVAQLTSLTIPRSHPLDAQKFYQLMSMPLIQLHVTLQIPSEEPVNWTQAPEYVRKRLASLEELSILLWYHSSPDFCSIGFELCTNLTRFMLHFQAYSNITLLPGIDLRKWLPKMTRLEELEIITTSGTEILTKSWAALKSLPELRRLSYTPSLMLQYQFDLQLSQIIHSLPPSFIALQMTASRSGLQLNLSESILTAITVHPHFSVIRLDDYERAKWTTVRDMNLTQQPTSVHVSALDKFQVAYYRVAASLMYDSYRINLLPSGRLTWIRTPQRTVE